MRLRGFMARSTAWLAIGWVGTLGTGASVAHSQQPPGGETRTEEQTEQAPVTPRPAPAPRIEVKTIDTSPAAEPQPALEYRFWPAWHELEPGNAAPLYLRAIIMLTSSGAQERWQEYEKFAGEGVPEPTDAEGMKAAKVWLDRYAYQSILDEVRRATYREDADFGHRIEALPGMKQFQYVLPDVQELRSIARLLDLRIRVAIADREYDEAIALLRDGFRLAGSLRESRLLISQFVGAAIAGIMLEDVRLLSKAPNSPNLYWALASLPRPLIQLRSSIAFEVDFAQRMLPSQANAPVDAEESNEYLTNALLEASQFSSEAGAEQQWMRRVMITSAVMQLYPQAKATLIADGVSESELEAMPVAAVMVRYMRRQLRRTSDDLQKWVLLPPEVQRLTAASREDPLEASLQEHSGKYNPVRLFLQFMSSVESAASIGTRYQAQRDAAMTIEAIRAHAAVHDGRLPERLDQLEPLPALPDPRTGEPFEWEVRTRDGVAEGVLRLEHYYRQGWTLEYHVRIQSTEG